MKILLIFCILTHFIYLKGQINPEKILIARDTFGVPHIFAKTDAEVAYGLAWAHSEDNFADIQKNLLSSKGYCGWHEGKTGVLFDFGMQFLDIPETVESQFDTSFTPEFKKVMEGYIQGVNDYAKAFPKEVLVKKARKEYLKKYPVKEVVEA